MNINKIRLQKIEQLKDELRQWQMFAEKMEGMAVSFEDAIERNSRILGGRHDISSWVTKAKSLREIIKLMPVAIKEDT